MRAIGLIGGMSWESTLAYYRLINEGVNARLDGLHSAKILLDSVDFAEIENCQSGGEWSKAAEILADSARRLEKAGADFLLLCTNTMHKVANEIQSATNIPFVHIADVTAEKLLEANIRKVGLLGTKYTLTEDFYKGRVASHGINVEIPDDQDIGIVNSIIFDELCKGVVKESSRRAYIHIIDKLKMRGAQAVVLGCTEIGMLIGVDAASVPVFDTTIIHAQKAVDLALKK